MKPLLALLLGFLFAAVPAQAQPNTTFTRIQFQPGATSAQVSGQVSGAVSAGYILGAAAGQHLVVGLDNASLTVVSPSGQPLVQGSATLYPVRQFSTVLPETGDYVIYVSVLANTAPTPFNMYVSITGTPNRFDSAERIRFQPGSSGAQVTGTLSGAQAHHYLLHASGGQTMTLAVDTGTLTVISPSGQPLVRGTVVSVPVRTFSQVLPETGDYRVSVNVPNNAGTIHYALSISITGSQSGASAPQRIRFSPGATSAQVSGQLVPGAVNAYVLGAFAGQVMTVSAPNTYISLISPSGVMLQANQPNALTHVLPETGDYTVRLTSVAGGTSLNYSASFSITGSSQRTTTTERIRFQTGSSGAQVTGQVSGVQDNRYVLFAFAGQFMQASVDSASLTVITPSGQPMVRGTATAGPVRNFGQVLPETGDYQIIVSAPAGSGAVGYTLTVTVTQ